jgi:hypothetical protein
MCSGRLLSRRHCFELPVKRRDADAHEASQLLDVDRLVVVRAIVARLFWVRGRESGFRMRVRLARGSVSPARRPGPRRLLVNGGNAPIDAIHVATPQFVETRTLAFDRPATRTLLETISATGSTSSRVRSCQATRCVSIS